MSISHWQLECYLEDFAHAGYLADIEELEDGRSGTFIFTGDSEEAGFMESDASVPYVKGSLRRHRIELREVYPYELEDDVLERIESAKADRENPSIEQSSQNKSPNAKTLTGSARKGCYTHHKKDEYER